MTQISLTYPAAVTILLERSRIFSVAPGISSDVAVAIPAESVAATVSAATDFGPYLADREVTLNLSLGTVVYEVKAGGAGGGPSVTVVNDLTTGGTTSALSAEMGKTLQASKLGASADAIADVLEDAATTAPTDLARIRSSVSGGVGTFATTSALQTAFPAASNPGKTALVGSAAPYTQYVSDGAAWSQPGGLTATQKLQLLPVSHTYLTPSKYRKWRTACSRARRGGASARLLVVGDSTARGAVALG